MCKGGVVVENSFTNMSHIRFKVSKLDEESGTAADTGESVEKPDDSADVKIEFINSPGKFH